MWLFIDTEGRFPLTPSGEPLLLDAPPAHATVSSDVEIRPGIRAARIHGVSAAKLSATTGDARSHSGDPLAARAVGLVQARERYRFDPFDGSPLSWGGAGIVARGASGAPIFPRVDPSVIGIVQHPEGDRILLGENSRRPGYYTAIAGYVDVGENLEDAFAREVWEETGRRVRDMRYVGSQPWPSSGALMLGFFGHTDDVEPAGPTDGELKDIIWASRADLQRLPLAREGSIARKLISAWAAGEFEGEQEKSRGY